MLYEAARHADLLTPVTVVGAVVYCDFRAPDETVFDGLALSTDYTLRYPLTWLPDLVLGQLVEVAGESYRVREIRAIGDGSEREATLSRS